MTTIQFIGFGSGCNCTICQRQQDIARLRVADDGLNTEERRAARRAAEKARRDQWDRKQDMSRAPKRRRDFLANNGAEVVRKLTGSPGIIRVSSLDEFKERLEAKGWTLLGAGNFSRAFGKGDLVWKVSRPNMGFDDGGLAYASDILAGRVRRSIHAPRCKMMLLADNGDYAVLMEKLEYELADEADRTIHSRVAESISYLSVEDLSIEAKGRVEVSLVAFNTTLSDHYEGRFGFDLHEGNVMKRKDGTWVITDPIAFPQLPIADCYPDAMQALLLAA